MKLKFGEFYSTKKYKYLPSEYFTILKIRDYEVEEVNDSLIIKAATIEENYEAINGYMHKKGVIKFNIDGQNTVSVVITRGFIDDNKKLNLELDVEEANTLASGSDTFGRPINN